MLDDFSYATHQKNVVKCGQHQSTASVWPLDREVGLQGVATGWMVVLRWGWLNQQYNRSIPAIDKHGYQF